MAFGVSSRVARAVVREIDRFLKNSVNSRPTIVSLMK